MKTTLKDIRRYVTTNAAEDLTKKRFAEIDTIRIAECGLHLLKVQGFCFALLQYDHTQAFTAVFYTIHAVILPTPQNSVQGFTVAFPLIWHIPADTIQQPHKPTMHRLCHVGAYHSAAALPVHTRYHRHTGRCTAQHSRPIIIMYIRARPCYGDPCQTAQHIAGHANPAGSAPTLCGSLASADSVSAVQTRRTC